MSIKGKGLMDMDNRVATAGKKGYKGTKWYWENIIKIICIFKRLSEGKEF